MGENARKVLLTRYQEGETVRILDERPEIPLHLRPVERAFDDLGRERPIGTAPGPIPVSKMEEWLDRRGVLDLEERATYLELLKAMDDEWLRLVLKSGEGSGADGADEFPADCD